MATQTQKTVRIGGACAFWGDTLTSTEQLLTKGTVDYIIYDYLAEVTLAVMASQRMADPNKGYAIDFVRDTIIPNLKLIKKNGTKIVANAGGVNPIGCGEFLQQELTKLGSHLKVAVVTGDDVLSHFNAIKAGTIQTEQRNADYPPFCITLNAYTGAQGVLDALALGADIVVTGRVADSALTLGILMHEFNWSFNNFDLLSQGSLAGHLLECGTQATGGNYTDWQSVNDYESIGFPIIECQENGAFVLSKGEETGGIVNIQSVAEQLVYEIVDPNQYLLPEVNCDWSNVELILADNAVKVSGGLGSKPSGKVKVAGTYPDGYKTSTAFVVYGLNATAKATLIGEKIKLKVNQILMTRGLGTFSQYKVDILGAGATSLHGQSLDSDIAEVVLKISATHPQKKALIILSKELAQASTSLAPGLCQLSGGRPNVHPMIRLFTCLMPKHIVEETVHFQGKDICLTPIDLQAHTQSPHSQIKTQHQKKSSLQSIKWQPGTHVKLIDLCFGRSGDKGDNANIGIIARNTEAWQLLQVALTAERVETLFERYLDKPTSRVERFLLPGIQALNFVLYDALGDGGFASLRVDGQGKGFAQLLLSEWIQIPHLEELKNPNAPPTNNEKQSLETSE